MPTSRQTWVGICFIKVKKNLENIKELYFCHTSNIVLDERRTTTSR